jgi:hypothetical protein
MDAVDKILFIIIIALSIFLGIFIGLIIADEVTSKKRIEPDYNIIIENGVSDTTYIYRFNK